MLINRIGDLALVLAIVFIFNYIGVIDYASVFCVIHLFTNQTVTFFLFDVELLTIICLLLFIGAVGKSAQLGLHS